jgi:hypothetical protein
LEEVVREANVLDRGRKGDEDGGEDAIGEVGEEGENAGCEPERVAEVSDAADCDLDEIGTMRFCMFEFEA